MIPLLIAIALLLAALYVLGLNLSERWRFRRLPGPRPDWLLGESMWSGAGVRLPPPSSCHRRRLACVLLPLHGLRRATRFEQVASLLQATCASWVRWASRTRWCISGQPSMVGGGRVVAGGVRFGGRPPPVAARGQAAPAASVPRGGVRLRGRQGHAAQQL